MTNSVLSGRFLAQGVTNLVPEGSPRLAGNGGIGKGWQGGPAERSRWAWGRNALTGVEMANKNVRRQRVSSPNASWHTKRASGFEPPTSSLGSGPVGRLAFAKTSCYNAAIHWVTNSVRDVCHRLSKCGSHWQVCPAGHGGPVRPWTCQRCFVRPAVRSLTVR